MEYNLIVKGEKKSVEADIKGQHMILKTDGQKISASFIRISQHQILLNMNGQQINAYILRDKDSKTIVLNGQSHQVLDADLAARNEPRKKGFANTARTVSSPMPAVVVSILADKGDLVEKGQKLVIVSAMKMETTLYAPHAGKVTGINAKEGDKVMPDNILVDIEKQGETA